MKIVESKKRGNKNWIDIYFNKIEKGDVIVGKKIYQLKAKWEYDLKHNGAYLNIDEGCKWINVIEKYFFNSSSREHILLTLPQKAQFLMFFGTLDEKTDKRFYKEFFLMVGRGYGKSTISGALQAASIILNSKSRNEFWNVAYVKKQATAVIKPLANIIRNSPIFIERGFEVQGREDTTKIVNLENPDFISGIKSLDGSSLQGMDFASMILDEIHTWKNKDLRTDINGGMKNEDAFTVIITTNGNYRGGLLDAVLNDSDYILNKSNYKEDLSRLLPWIYTIDDYENWNTEIEAQKANPNWSEKMFSSRRREIISNLKMGKHTGYSASFKTTNLNMSITSDNALFDYEELQYDSTFDLNEFIEQNPNAVWFAGIDLGHNHDLTSIALIHYDYEADKIYCINKNYIGKRGYEHHSNSNRFPIDIYLKRGELEISGLKSTDNLVVVDYINKMSEKLNIQYIGYDPSDFSKVANHFDIEMGWTTDNYLHKIPQSAGHLHEHLLDLQSIVRQENLHYNNNFMKWQLGNIQIMETRQGASTKWLPDNTNKDLLHDAGSAIFTAMAARYQYKKRYDIVDV